MNLPESAPEKATKMIKGSEHSSYEKGLRELGLLQPGEERVWEDLGNIYKHQKGE